MCIFLHTAKTRLHINTYFWHLKLIIWLLISSALELYLLAYTRTWYFPFLWRVLDFAYMSGNQRAIKLDTSWFMVHRGFNKQQRNFSIRLNRKTVDTPNSMSSWTNTFINLPSWKSIAYRIQILQSDQTCIPVSSLPVIPGNTYPGITLDYEPQPEMTRRSQNWKRCQLSTLYCGAERPAENFRQWLD